MKGKESNISEEGEKTGDKIVVEPRIKSDLPGVQAGLVLEGRGKVVSVEAEVATIKPGDDVTFDQTAGQDVLLFGKLLKILKESEVTPATEG